MPGLREVCLPVAGSIQVVAKQDAASWLLRLQRTQRPAEAALPGLVPSASAEEAGEESKRGSVDKSRGLFTGSPIEPGYGEAGLGTGRFGD